MKIGSKHLANTRKHIKSVGYRYGYAIVKWDRTKTWIAGSNLKKLNRFVSSNVNAGIYKHIKFIKIKR